MRAKTPEPELLEPLPVEVDGVTLAPEAVARDVFVRENMPTTREIVDAIRATVADAQSVRGVSPWAQSPAPAAPPMHAVHVIAAFSRMLALAPARLDALPAWWSRHADDGRVEVGGRLALQAPRHRAAGTWCMRGRLRRPGRARSIAVEVVLWPHLGAWTKLSVEPQHRVRIGRRYFRSGHRVLDVLTDRLIREL